MGCASSKLLVASPDTAVLPGKSVDGGEVNSNDVSKNTLLPETEIPPAPSACNAACNGMHEEDGTSRVVPAEQTSNAEDGTSKESLPQEPGVDHLSLLCVLKTSQCDISDQCTSSLYVFPHVSSTLLLTLFISPFQRQR